jgi:hypothetical protein
MAQGNRRRKTAPRVSKTPRIRKSPLARVDVTRAEYNRIIDVLNERGELIDGLQRELDVQLRRIGQIQSELDEVRRDWLKKQRTAGDAAE